MISAEQCKAGRAVLEWSQGDLASESGVSMRTVQDFEAGHRKPNSATLQALLAALERNGLTLNKDGAAIAWGGFRGITIDPRKVGMGDEIE